ncbi:MAG TPA: phosphoribosylanthranilate isomerase [Bryobacteraceae bacterium]|jgi:phosphoribosylanthranilate isomerase|nr:phosphoribosylanthranilate isomerase [Bryobacteraceae bacterium]
MFVKICGITNREDAMAAIGAGARALGFIFYPPSPRSVTVEQLERWIGDLPAEIWKVGVFVDEPPEAIESTAARIGLDVAQLHGAETPDRHPKDLRIWKAFRAERPDAAVPDYPAAEAVLIDGAAYDWKRTAHFTRPLILAGRLDPENVCARVAQARPWGVDVASGVESSPGRKDHGRMKRFIEAALRA